MKINIKKLFNKKRTALNDATQRAFNYTLKEFRTRKPTTKRK